jgi:hypothetical protein
MTTISHPTHLLNNLLELRAFTLIASYLPRLCFASLNFPLSVGGEGVRG